MQTASIPANAGKRKPEIRAAHGQTYYYPFPARLAEISPAPDPSEANSTLSLTYWVMIHRSQDHLKLNRNLFYGELFEFVSSAIQTVCRRNLIWSQIDSKWHSSCYNMEWKSGTGYQNRPNLRDTQGQLIKIPRQSTRGFLRIESAPKNSKFATYRCWQNAIFRRCCSHLCDFAIFLICEDIFPKNKWTVEYEEEKTKPIKRAASITTGHGWNIYYFRLYASQNALHTLKWCDAIAWG